MTKTYGTGDSAEKLNVGLDHSQDSTMLPGGKVVNKNGDTVFDPEDDAVEVKTPDRHGEGAPENDEDTGNPVAS